MAEENFAVEHINGNTPSDEKIAEICHEVNRAWCEYNGDTSQPKWADAPDWQKASAVQGVAFHRENPDAGDDANHNSWMKFKLEDGWVWGAQKNPTLKQHPCIVQFEQLPADQQFKDRLFRTIVHAGLT